MAKNKNKIHWFALSPYKQTLKDSKDTCEIFVEFAGTRQELKKLKAIIDIEGILAVVLVIAQGLLRIEGMQVAKYVLIPYILEIIAVFVFGLFVVRVSEKAEAMKLSVYNKTIKVRPVTCIALSIVAFAGLVGTIIYLCLYGFEGCTGARIVYILIKLAIIALGLFSFFEFKKYEWN